MGQCSYYDEANDTLCPNQATRDGLCPEHYARAQLAKQPLSPKAIELTLPELKKAFGAVGQSVGDGTGGSFLGGAKNEPHVHKYGGPGAHVKVGNEEYRFLRPVQKNSFDVGMWDEGIKAAKGLDNAKKLFAAMSMTLCDYSGLGEVELKKQLKKLSA